LVFIVIGSLMGCWTNPFQHPKSPPYTPFEPCTNGTTLHLNSHVPQITKLTSTNRDFIWWSLQLLKWAAMFLTWMSCLCTSDVTLIDILACHIMCLRGGYIVWVVPLAFHSLPWKMPQPNYWRYWVGPFIPEFTILPLKVNLLYIFSYNSHYY
jgi:hypothetical protein